MVIGVRGEGGLAEGAAIFLFRRHESDLLAVLLTKEGLATRERFSDANRDSVEKLIGLVSDLYQINPKSIRAGTKIWLMLQRNRDYSLGQYQRGLLAA